MTDACRLSRWTETYLDGELSPEHTVDYEDHLSDCCCCREKLKFEQALRFSMRRTVRVATYPSPDFESRIRAAMVVARECAPEGAEAKPAPEPNYRDARVVPLHSRPLTWHTIAPLSVAAAAALVFAAMRNVPSTSEIPGPTTAGMVGESRSKDTMQTVREFLDQLAADSEHHPEASAAIDVDGEQVFVAARPPSIINLGQRRWPLPELKNLGAIWEGLHYRNLATHGRVPSLHYRIGGHRVLVWAYDADRTPLRAVLHARVARSQPVFVGTRNGMSIAAVENDNRGIAITTDLSTSEAAELAVTASMH